MLRSLPTFRRTAAIALIAAGLLAACSDDDPPTAGGSLAGSYAATTFRVVVPGQPEIDVLARGGSLTLNVAADRTTTGALLVPASVTGDVPFTASMAGTAVQTGNTVRFQQTADTFVRDLTWTASGATLQVTDQAAGSTRFTITLTRR